jgi:hypothetical protein
VGVRWRLDGVVVEAEGRGAAGDDGMAGGRWRKKKGRVALEVEGAPDRWSPPVSERGERRRREVDRRV